MKLKLALVGLAATPLLGGCTTDELALFDAALSLYSDLEYLDGDCPFGMNRYYDVDGHHHCTYADVPDRPRYGGNHHGGHHGHGKGDTGHDDDDNDGGD